ncbi:Ubiquitin-conjugating enzyme E2Q-like protein 1 [Lamellibrachia satsuma]|nr:Ubiquitin-conjugating enzyme E2Q-like protein 1 [Lamellibrachia satsuma]
MDSLLSYLRDVQKLLKSCQQKTLTNILDIVEDSLSPLLQEDAESENDEDEDDFGYEYYEDNEEAAALCTVSSVEVPAPPGLVTSGGGNPMAVNRLLKDLTALKSSEGKFGFKGQPQDDNLFVWDVQLTDFPRDSPLGQDLQEYAKTYHREPVIHMEMKFPEDYPMSPPFVRVIRPAFKFLTGHVTIGGSICMELLTRSGWKPTNDIEGILVQIRAEIMSDVNARLHKNPDKVYEEAAARAAFQRMEKTYGWNE